MPIIHVHLKKGSSSKYRRDVAGAIKRSMIDVLGLPDDDYNQITYEHDPENMIYNSNFFGVPRSEKMLLISMSFNTRPPEQKKRLFEIVANNIVKMTGTRIEDIMMMIIETPAENWWAFARTVNPETGLDSRMLAPTQN